jgi:hypothetical protein
VRPVAHYLGLLAALLGRDEADTHFAHALDIATRIEAPLFAAMTRIEWGALRLPAAKATSKKHAPL